MNFWQQQRVAVTGGAKRIAIEKFHPSVFIEVEDNALRAMGSSASKVFDMVRTAGYSIHRLNKGRISPPLEIADAMSLSSDGRYADFLLLYQPARIQTQ